MAINRPGRRSPIKHNPLQYSGPLVRQPRLGQVQPVIGMSAESTDIIKDTKQAIEDKKNEIGSISGIINFHCILRTLELEQKGTTEEYGKIFTDIPTIGFSTYGEEYMGHINQTSTMLVFK